MLLKGATTLVVAPGRGATAWSQADAPAWLATAGAGDVLAGLLGTLLAAGLAADEAGASAALVHGVAADRANPGGPVRALGRGARHPGGRSPPAAAGRAVARRPADSIGGRMTDLRPTCHRPRARGAPRRG